MNKLLVVLTTLVAACSILPAAEASQSFAADKTAQAQHVGVPPVIDLSNPNDDQLAQEIADACSTFGFFQVTSHGLSDDLMNRFQTACQQFFALPLSTKKKMKRNSHNPRGFFDDELTKQKRDWKECLDIGMPGSGQWDVADESPFNCCLDGFNQFPNPTSLPTFRETIVEYFDACAKLSHRLACLMARGMGLPEDDPFIQDLLNQHSSYLRMNYYPPCPTKEEESESADPGAQRATSSLLKSSSTPPQGSAATSELPSDTNSDNPPLGISPHKDAGFLTVLLQDDNCHSLQALIDGQFVSVRPVPGALTINTGDMAEIWSNGKYKAPLHRVLTSSDKKRYSAPFFYNPGYDWLVQPVLQNDGEMPKYFGCLWGYFRALRFAGDLTNLGVEIQTDDFETQRRPPSAHLARQKYFQEGRWTSLPFDIDRYRILMQEFPDE